MRPIRAHETAALSAVQQRALHAALSATLALGLAACGAPAVDQGEEGKDGEGFTEAGADGAAGGADGAATDSGGASDTGAASDTGGADAGGGEAMTCADVAPDALAACCAALQEACVEAFPGDFDAQYECAWGEGTGCIPWGPPVPPAMA